MRFCDRVTLGCVLFVIIDAFLWPGNVGLCFICHYQKRERTSRLYRGLSGYKLMLKSKERRRLPRIILSTRASMKISFITSTKKQVDMFPYQTPRLWVISTFVELRQVSLRFDWNSFLFWTLSWNFRSKLPPRFQNGIKHQSRAEQALLAVI